MTPTRDTSLEQTLIKLNNVVSYKVYPKADVAKGLLYILKEIQDEGVSHVFPIGKPDQAQHPLLPDCKTLGVNFDTHTIIFRFKYENRMKIAFDYDGTLEYKEIQELVKLVQDMGHEAIIVTSRYEDALSHKYNKKVSEAFPRLANNEEVHKMAEKFGVKLYFTNMEYKNATLLKLKANALIDDNTSELHGLDAKIVGFDSYDLATLETTKEKFLRFLFTKEDN
jgi:hypothetical protein